jgi:diguanylate cyclase (GGDEF)-like protein
LLSELTIAGSIALTGGPRSPALAWLVIPLVTLPARFNGRAVAAGVGLVVVLLLATTFGVDAAYCVAHPQTIVMPIALVVAVALLSSALMTSDLEHRSSSVIDPLTGMLNRNALQTRVKELAQQAAVMREPVALVVGDLDRFKTINDGHGHAVGDAVLRDVAYRMRKALRAYDLAYRLGGEEFLIMLPGADREAARHVAETLRRAICDEPVAGLPATISFGVSASDPGEFAYDTVFAEADLALYRSKQEGRNRVRVSGDGAAPLARAA